MTPTTELSLPNETPDIPFQHRADTPPSTTASTSETPEIPKPKTALTVKGLQTKEHGHILNIIHQVRKHGLEGDLALPQIVVGGDQSSGKSSLLAALTGLQLPRSDNMCTRYATEINLRPGTTFSVSLKIIPDPDRPLSEQVAIRAFYKYITNLDELPAVMMDAMVAMGITTLASTDSDNVAPFRAISKDVLCLDIEGPDRPQLTLVDIPGIIATKTKDASEADVDAIDAITDKYISQPRTIVLAVVSAAHDYANQRILKRVRDADPAGARSLGIITKPDRVQGDGSKKSFLELAQNQDIKFKLGWHVVKNRSSDEEHFTMEQQKQAETKWFRQEFMKGLPAHIVGVDSLRTRLSVLLFEHVKRELPNLRAELEATLEEAKSDLNRLGARRSTPSECKAYLQKICMAYYAICKAAIEGHYEGSYFRSSLSFSLTRNRRARAVVQDMNAKFAEKIRKTGHKYFIDFKLDKPAADGRIEEILEVEKNDQPMKLSRQEAIAWARYCMAGTKGKELSGNFNPLLIGELFFEQSLNWKTLAADHVDKVYDTCCAFLLQLLRDKCPDDVRGRIWECMKEDLKRKKANADEELEKLVVDLVNYPINYNHYYTETIHKCRHERNKAALATSIEAATTSKSVRLYQGGEYEKTQTVDVGKAIASYTQHAEADMEDFAGLEALDCLISIYKVSSQTPHFFEHQPLTAPHRFP